MKRLALFAMITAGTLANANEPPSPPSIEQAVKRAHEAHLPVLLDFSAVWCHACYFMATHVLKGPQWQALEEKISVVAIDADSIEATNWKQKFDIKGLPTFIVLNDAGDEVGRTFGSDTTAEFVASIQGFVAASSTLEELQKKAALGKAADVRSVLSAYRARLQAKQGLAWYATLPKTVRARVTADADLAQMLDQMNLDRAAEDQASAAAITIAQRLLSRPIGCDRIEVLDILVEQSAKLKTPRRKDLLEAQKPAMDKLTDEMFAGTSSCTDRRFVVQTATKMAVALEDHADEAAIYDRAIVDARRSLGDNLAQDRNLADDLRVYLVLAKRYDELDALMPKMIAAYPDDYVYLYRWGHNLLERKEPARALPYLERAAELATGANRLTVAIDRINALKALHRQSDADQVAAATLKENGDWFPKQVEQLKAALKS